MGVHLGQQMTARSGPRLDRLVKGAAHFSLRQVNTNKNKIIYIGISTNNLD